MQNIYFFHLIMASPEKGKYEGPKGPLDQVENVIHVDNIDQSFKDVPELQYDQAGISGIVKSPYVVGVGLLASFGGFSFGYGEISTLRFPWAAC